MFALLLAATVLTAPATSAADSAYLVKDLNAYPPDAIPSSVPYSFMEFDGSVYFNAWTAEHGTEWWKTDGTAEGTERFTDVLVGPGNSNTGALTVVGDRLFYFGLSYSDGYTLFATDGTIAGTVPLGQFPYTGGEQVITDWMPFGGAFLFTAYSSAVGHEIWRSDGTLLGTHPVADLNPATASSA